MHECPKWDDEKLKENKRSRAGRTSDDFIVSDEDIKPAKKKKQTCESGYNCVWADVF